MFLTRCFLFMTFMFSIIANISANELPKNIRELPPGDFLIEAHRGFGVEFPEGTRESFLLAWQQGIIPEADTNVTKDGVIVSIHDPNFQRYFPEKSEEFRKKNIKDLTWDEIRNLDFGSWKGDRFKGQKIFAITDLCEEMKKDITRRVIFDLKTANLKELAHISEGLHERIYATDTFPERLREWKRYAPTSKTIWWLGGHNEDDLRARLRGPQQEKFRGIDMIQLFAHIDNKTGELVPRADFLKEMGNMFRESGIVFMIGFWCNPKDQSGYDKLFDTGCIGVSTDFPENVKRAWFRYVANQKEMGRRTEIFNDEWIFTPIDTSAIRKRSVMSYSVGDETEREKKGKATPVRLPHDWAIHANFDQKYGGNTGMLPWQGVGIYTKKFHPNPMEQGKRFVLDFDGAMAFPEVTVNGKYAGGWDYGYLGFQVDITRFLQFDQENVIEVRCDTREHHSRWYPGAGLYRPVRLLTCSPDAWLPQGAIVITTPSVTPKSTMSGSATINVKVLPQCDTPSVKNGSISLEIFDDEGKRVWQDVHSCVSECQFTTTLENVKLWDVNSPRLYRAIVRLATKDKKPLDECSVTFGVRSFQWTHDDGFHLNGRRVQLQGVNLHHDQGILGAAAHPAAIARQLKIMKDIGVNAIRTSHNPPSPDFLDLCDKMGLIVWNELFDKWDGTCGFRKGDDFPRFMDRQIRQFVSRDQNHPSVFAWSIGNEIWSIEKNLYDLSNPNNDAARRVKFMHDTFCKYDTTRPVAQGCLCNEAIGPDNSILESLDMTGWNYGAKYREAHVRFPKMPLVYTESASALSTRGHYVLTHPKDKVDFDASAFQVDSYDLNSASGPRDIPDIDFERMNIDRYIAGEFVWTGFDYIGEPTPFESRAKSSYFGIVDLCGIPKDRFFLYRSHWQVASPTVHILPHWNWADRKGKQVPVYVYTSGDSAELFLNGRSLGKRSKDSNRSLEKPKEAKFDLPDYYWIVDKYRLRWENVEYQPGTLEAVAWKNGKEIGRHVVKTADTPVQWQLSPESKSFGSNDDLCYILVETVDKNGIVCPTDTRKFSVKIQGPAELAGIANGNPIDLDPFTDSSHSLFYGKAMIVIRNVPFQHYKNIILSVESNDGLAPASVEIKPCTVL